MNISPSCPCCSGKLIHHLSHRRDYWFCRTCWQEMPPIERTMSKIKIKQGKRPPEIVYRTKLNTKSA